MLVARKLVSSNRLSNFGQTALLFDRTMNFSLKTVMNHECFSPKKQFTWHLKGIQNQYHLSLRVCTVYFVPMWAVWFVCKTLLCAQCFFQYLMKAFCQAKIETTETFFVVHFLVERKRRLIDANNKLSQTNGNKAIDRKWEHA